MHGYAFNRRSNRITLQCTHAQCDNFVTQEVPFGRPPKEPVCLDCQTRVGNWLWRECRRIEAQVVQKDGCELCPSPLVVGVAWLPEPGDWVRCCVSCYRMIARLQDMRGQS